MPGYALGARLGSGGYGTVWESRASADGAVVAVKVGHSAEPRTCERFRREARALVAVGPPHVPEHRESGRNSRELQ